MAQSPRFDNRTGVVRLLLVAEGSDLEMAVGLFQKLIGDYEVVFTPATMEEVSGYSH